MRRVFSLLDMEYFKDDQRMPIYLQKNTDMNEIFNGCTGGINDPMIAKKVPSSKENAVFILDQRYLPYSSPIRP